MAHVLEHVPAAGGDAESCEITQIDALLCAATENVHGIVDEGSRMSFPRDRNITYAIKLGPGIRSRVICPDIIEPSNAIRTTKAMGW